MKFLALDDDPGRYDNLQRELGIGKNTLKIVLCKECFQQEAESADVFLLDYDLDAGNVCATCGNLVAPTKSMEYLSILEKELKKRKVPPLVIITSCSAPANRRKLQQAILRFHDYCIQEAADSYKCELIWVGQSYLHYCFV